MGRRARNATAAKATAGRSPCAGCATWLGSYRLSQRPASGGNMSAPASAPRLAFGVVRGISIVLASSAGALASTVSVGGGTLSYSADPNEINEVTIERVGGFFRVRDDTATLSTVDPDCTEINAHLTRCLQAP